MTGTRKPRPSGEIAKDLTAPTQPTRAGPGMSRELVCCSLFLTQMPLLDGDVSVRIKPVAGREDAVVGLAWRYLDENNDHLVALARTR